MKKDVLRMKAVSLDLDETLIALGISATTEPGGARRRGAPDAAGRVRVPHHAPADRRATRRACAALA